jgi:DNA polymerase-3 subunit epsilon
VAGEFVSLLRGRVLAAHNASFERRFIEAELARLGHRPPRLADATLCTMQLAGQLLPVANRSLASCCAACGIELRDAHRAVSDATATARLLSKWLREMPDAPWWHERSRRARELIWPSLQRRNVALVRRRSAGERKPHFLERIAERMPPHTGPAEHNEYLALLDRCLLDRKLSVHEQQALVALANELGIGRSTCRKLHEEYFAEMVRLAWEDRSLSDDERDDLRAVAALLAIPDDQLAAALQSPGETPSDRSALPLLRDAFRLQRNDRIVLTGKTRRPREDWHSELERLGLVPTNSVSRKVKLVVAADVDSLSDKARKARELGIPIVDEEGLIALLQRM